ncbi:MAG: M48 family metalloprotease [Planctomycetia bacterium]|nr:M48 family metalloprotease [Planctomycetia bacterium]
MVRRSSSRVRLGWLVVGGLLGLPFVPSAGPATAVAGDLEVGAIRTAQNRDGVTLRELALPLGKKVLRVQYGTQLKVLEVRELWVKVAPVADLTKVGWVRTNEIAEPATLSASAAAVPSFSTSDVSAAGRQLTEQEKRADPKLAEGLQYQAQGAGKQFDQKTENTYRTMDAKVSDAYPLVDKVERTSVPEDELEAFVREGRLGGTAEASAPVGVGPYARLKLLGATGDTEGVIAFSDEHTPMPPAVSDAEFVKRLGVGFTPEHEYWLGRAVAAAAIAEHGLDPNPTYQALVRKVGASIVLLSDRLRATHGGWHFAVLDSPVANAIAGPGGFVLVTRGALELARNEDEVAAILAHEMAHIAYKHGEQMVRKSREFQEGLAALERRVTEGPRPGEDCNICGEVAKTLGTSAKALVKTLDVEGYGRDLELAADWAGSLFLCEVGYRASAVAEYLEMLPTREGARWTTHPTSEDRIEALRPLVFKHGCPLDSDEGAQARIPRFRAVGLVAPK